MSERRLRSSARMVLRPSVPQSAHSGAPNNWRISSTYVYRSRWFLRRQFCGAEKEVMLLTSTFLPTPPYLSKSYPAAKYVLKG